MGHHLCTFSMIKKCNCLICFFSCRMLAEAERIEKMEHGRREKEARQLQHAEAKRKRLEELQRQKQEEAVRKIQEREQKRQQTALIKEQVRILTH